MKHSVGFLLLCFTVLGDTSKDDPLQRVSASKDDPLQRVSASVGLPAVLPCLQDVPENTEVPTIEWSKVGPGHKRISFVYRQGFEVYAEKHPDFRFRTHLFMSDLQYGNFSMRLSDVRATDAGKYVCKTLWSEGPEEKTVELTVEGTENSCTVPMILVGLGSVTSVLLVLGVAFLIYKYCRRSAKEKNISHQSSIETSTSSVSEHKPLMPQTSSTVIEMDETQLTNVSSGPPDLLCSTPTSTISSKADSRTGSICSFFEDTIDGKSPTCEIRTPSKSVKFLNEEEGKRKPLIRQDACSDQEAVPQSSLSKSTFSLSTEISKSPTKKPVRRSRSESDSCFVVDEVKSQRRRNSTPVQKPDMEKLLQKVQEEPETDRIYTRL